MWYSNILIAYDGSAPSERALAVANEMALSHPDAKITFTYVLRIVGGSAEDTLVQKAVRAEAHLQGVADKLPNQTEVVILRGSSPADLILKCADDRACDVIVMGSRGMGGVKGYLGSVSYAVVQKAKCCVFIAKNHNEGGAR